MAGIGEMHAGLFSGPVYQSQGGVVDPGPGKPINWGDPNLAADFFRADQASMRPVPQAANVPLPPQRPAGLGQPAPAPAPAMAPAMAPRQPDIVAAPATDPRRALAPAPAMPQMSPLVEMQGRGPLHRYVPPHPPQAPMPTPGPAMPPPLSEDRAWSTPTASILSQMVQPPAPQPQRPQEPYPPIPFDFPQNGPPFDQKARASSVRNRLLALNPNRQR